MLCFLQNNSHFRARLEGLTPRGALYLFFLGQTSFAFKYDTDSGVVILEDYNEAEADARALFLFIASPALSVRFSDDDRVCTRHNNGHL